MQQYFTFSAPIVSRTGTIVERSQIKVLTNVFLKSFSVSSEKFEIFYII